MSVDVGVAIKISKGDPKEVLSVIRKQVDNFDVIALSTFVTGARHLYPEYAPYFDIDAEYETDDAGFTVIKFYARNWTPDAILYELSEHFPQHEFIIVRGGYEQMGEEKFILRNGEYTLVSNVTYSDCVGDGDNELLIGDSI